MWERYDWIYEDEDRTFELWLEISANKRTDDAIDIFVDYASREFRMDIDDMTVLDIIIRYYDWSDIPKCIEKLQEQDDWILDFLKKYKFKIRPEIIEIKD